MAVRTFVTRAIQLQGETVLVIRHQPASGYARIVSDTDSRVARLLVKLSARLWTLGKEEKRLEGNHQRGGLENRQTCLFNKGFQRLHARQ
ncbi:hypothetical protein PAHA111176_17530 [Parendozoicomonas haliclonae]|uniref:Uncharacterized protein n=1 Tax=Parendozoicomonas haliclonae TaxID=1960125 RepID=A0A1X7ANX9_9GAMM|nr:hypothetical protein EHSB41UT_03643 [Parendozoicomonas haliclonae]